MTLPELAERIRNGAFQKICAAHGAVVLMRVRQDKADDLQELVAQALGAALLDLQALDRVLLEQPAVDDSDALRLAASHDG